MKRITRTALVVSVILLIINIVYVVNHLKMMNILHFLGLAILLPCVLISLMIAGVIAETHFREVKQQAFMTGIFGGVIAILAYTISRQNLDYIEKIVDNSEKMTESSYLSVSDISMNNGGSSYVFIFIIIFVLSMGFSILFNILRERRTRNVS